MEKNIIDIPDFVQGNRKKVVYDMMNCFTDGNTDIYVKVESSNSNEFRKIYLKDKLNEEILKRYNRLKEAKEYVRVSKEQSKIIKNIEYKKLCHSLKKEILELEKYQTYVMSMSESEVSNTSEENLRYELIQTIREMKPYKN